MAIDCGDNPTCNAKFAHHTDRPYIEEYQRLFIIQGKHVQTPDARNLSVTQFLGDTIENLGKFWFQIMKIK